MHYYYIITNIGLKLTWIKREEEVFAMSSGQRMMLTDQWIVAFIGEMCV